MIKNTKKKRLEILGIGDVMVDLSTRASQLPKRGGNVWSTAVSQSPGGTTANIIAITAKLGIFSGFAGCVGDDPFGHYSINELKKLEVDTNNIVVRQGSYTGIVLAIIDDTGERSFIACAKGAAHSLLSVEDVNAFNFQHNPNVIATGVCLVEEPSRTALLYALQKARSSGCLVYYDPNLRLEGDIFSLELHQDQLQAISYSDVVLIGDEEMQLIFNGLSHEECVKKFHNLGVKIVIVKQGQKGATLFTGNDKIHFPAFQVPVVSTTGAGDSFDAGFIAARLRNGSLHDSLAYASAVAGFNITQHGSRSVPNHQKILEFLKEKDCFVSLTQ